MQEINNSVKASVLFVLHECRVLPPVLCCVCTAAGLQSNSPVIDSYAIAAKKSFAPACAACLLKRREPINAQFESCSLYLSWHPFRPPLVALVIPVAEETWCYAGRLVASQSHDKVGRKKPCATRAWLSTCTAVHHRDCPRPKTLP